MSPGAAVGSSSVASGSLSPLAPSMASWPSPLPSAPGTPIVGVTGKGQKKGSQPKLPCPICQKLFAQMPKHSQFCYQHKQSVEEASRQAKEQGGNTLQQFLEKSKTPASMDFRKLILDFEASCPARGRGRPRSKYAWAAMLEEWAASTKHAKDLVGLFY